MGQTSYALTWIHPDVNAQCYQGSMDEPGDHQAVCILKPSLFLVKCRVGALHTKILRT
jgi:hypothetical protein